MKGKAIEIMPNKLYWISDSKPPQSQKEAYYFSIDSELVYQPFFEDFGPLNLGQTHAFCMELNKLVTDPSYKKAKIYHYCSENFKKKANAAYLMGAYQVIFLKKTPEEAWKPFEEEKFTDFRDAMRGTCTYKCTIFHCLEALEYALKVGWYHPDKFNLNDYQFYEKVENGDLNWIIPGKFVAFSTPVDSSDASDFTFGPDYYVPIFKKLGVGMVIRLNTKEYDREKFVKKGIKHLDLFFNDGTCPTDEQVEKFLTEAEKEPGAIAVHCKAGLGRTGTMISCYAMKHYKISGEAMISWNRICRPGSILGPQQHFIIEKEKKMHALPSKIAAGLGIGEVTEKMKKMSVGGKDSPPKMSPKDKHIAVNGDAGQAEGLLGAKKQLSTKK